MSTDLQTTLTLLGPYPGNGSVSTWKYFNFLRAGVPGSLPGYTVKAMHPGNGAMDAVAAAGPRGRAWLDNYVLWPKRLALSHTGLFHVVDHGLAWYARFLGRSRRIVTVHDLISFLTTRGALPLPPLPRKRMPILWETMRQIRAADHIVAVSHNTADCLIRHLEIPAKRITIIHNFVDPMFMPLPPDQFAAVRARFFNDAQYAVIHVGKPSGYKNRITALRAFHTLLRRVPEARMFIVHGLPDAEEAAFLQESGCSHAVHFFGPLSIEDLRYFYGAADVLIFPSLYEGFGWPPVEAMACGCPVVCSPCGSLAEVVADAALVVQDPRDHVALAQALASVLTDAALASSLRERGFHNVERFQSSTMLERNAEVYRALLN